MNNRLHFLWSPEFLRRIPHSLCDLKAFQGSLPCFPSVSLTQSLCQTLETDPSALGGFLGFLRRWFPLFLFSAPLLKSLLNNEPLCGSPSSYPFSLIIHPSLCLPPPPSGDSSTFFFKPPFDFYERALMLLIPKVAFLFPECSFSRLLFPRCSVFSKFPEYFMAYFFFCRVCLSVWASVVLEVLLKCL